MEAGNNEWLAGVENESGMRSARRIVRSATCATLLLGGVLVGWAVPSSVAAQRSGGVVPASSAWHPDTPLPQKRSTVVARRGADGLIYAFGSGPRIEVFNPSTHRWSVRIPGPATAVPP